jgi:hypothetical protein
MSDLARFCGVHALSSTAGRAMFARHGITTRDLQRARTRYEQAESLPIGTLIGLNERGLLGATRRGYDPDRHAAFDQLLIHIPWQRILELLGREPDARNAGT